LATYSSVYCYATIANSQFYWFYAYLGADSKANEQIDSLFNSIVFDKALVKENAFAPDSIYLTR
jgi:hypothetical protein